MIIEQKKLTKKQEQIIRASIDLISEKGYDKVSTAEIAKRAGVGEGTIFKHYKTKKNLLLSIIIPFYIRFIAPVMADNLIDKVFNKEYDSFESFIYKLVDDRIDFVIKEEKMLKILIQEFIAQDIVKEEASKIFAQKIYPKVNKVVLEFKEKDEIIDISTGEVIRIILSNMFGYIMERFIFCIKKDYDTEYDKKLISSTIIKSLSK